MGEYDIGQVYIFTSDVGLNVLLSTEEALTDEDMDWLRWLATDFEDDEPAIEDDYSWIRGGC